MLLIVALLMTVVLVFLIRGVQDFYTKEFELQMESVLTQSQLLNELRNVAGTANAVSHMDDILRTFSGLLGIDQQTRNFYILDRVTGEVLETSDPARKGIDITPNILEAMRGNDAYTGTPRSDFMDIAVPIIPDEMSEGYVVYIVDNKQTAQRQNAEILRLIIEAVLIGFVIAILISLIISKALLSPIQGMTKAAGAMADGDFSRKINVESEDEIGALAMAFNDMAAQIGTMLDELHDSEMLRREFVANVSHELRTPLTSIRTYAETMSESRNIPPETEEEFLRVIINESDRMTKIVQDLLELSSYDSGTSKLAAEEFSIEKSIRDVYAAIALEARRRGHVLNLELEWRLPKIKGERARIEQVFMNVITNALKYTPDGGTINIFSGTAGDFVWVRIEDTGMGIPKEDLEHVFDRFYRVDKARSRESGGTGLGLSIAKEIVERHGGQIEIESTPGEGTVVTVMLPKDITHQPQDMERATDE
jgi:signal transduction histidine kinase